MKANGNRSILLFSISMIMFDFLFVFILHFFSGFRKSIDFKLFSNWKVDLKTISRTNCWMLISYCCFDFLFQSMWMKSSETKFCESMFATQQFLSYFYSTLFLDLFFAQSFCNFVKMFMANALLKTVYVVFWKEKKRPTITENITNFQTRIFLWKICSFFGNNLLSKRTTWILFLIELTEQMVYFVEDFLMIHKRNENRLILVFMKFEQNK